MKLHLKLLRLVVCAAIALTTVAIAQQPPTSTALMDAAKKQAKAEKKNIFVMFDASW